MYYAIISQSVAIAAVGNLTTFTLTLDLDRIGDKVVNVKKVILGSTRIWTVAGPTTRNPDSITVTFGDGVETGIQVTGPLSAVGTTFTNRVQGEIFRNGFQDYDFDITKDIAFSINVYGNVVVNDNVDVNIMIAYEMKDRKQASEIANADWIPGDEPGAYG